MSATLDPHSKIGLTGWLAVLVVASVMIAPIGPSIKNTLWYKYRPITVWEHAAYFIAFIWTCAMVLMGVSWYYTLTVTSNNGWINQLFLHQVYSYDVILALIFVSVILVKSYSWFFCTMDYWHFRFSAYTDYSKKDLAADIFNPLPSNTAARNRLETTVRYREAVSGATDVETFKANMVKFNLNNNWVRWGTFVYSLAVIGFGATIFGFLATKYNYAPADHSYVVIFWTWFVALVIMVFGFIYNCCVVYWTYPSTPENIKEMTSGVDASLVEYRNLETMSR